MPDAEHLDDTRYFRFHKDVYLPENVIVGALDFLPDSGVLIGLGDHYKKITGDRRLPRRIIMPEEFEIIDVTVVRDTWAIFRVCIRMSWGRREADLVLVLDGDYEAVTAYWNARGDTHGTLDIEGYERAPDSTIEERR